MFDLSGKVAIVTGGGSGIGEAICYALARHGADVCLVEINVEQARRVEAGIAAGEGRATVYPCDVGDQQAVEAVFAQIHQRHGSIDILVNNAGIAHIGTVETTTEEEVDHLFRVNVKGVYNGMKAAVPYMKAQGGGSIVNLASIVSTVGIPDRFAYMMSKGAVLTMTLSVATDYLNDNIRCNCVAPARVHTPFVDGYLKQHYPGREQEMFDNLSKTQPIGRMGRPDEIATLVLYLASDESGFITGANLPIDGGFVTLHP